MYQVAITTAPGFISRECSFLCYQNTSLITLFKVSVRIIYYQDDDRFTYTKTICEFIIL